uniref:non-specific serine/threonine protein kinase n=1 Tax=Nelumbo nucifera TaxID=4432 RepID=A0A822Y5S1_NELNU|nr:TPA_asm: hypothetical protein HUJ06_030792 [Nelumbo nucifera]
MVILISTLLSLLGATFLIFTFIGIAYHIIHRKTRDTEIVGEEQVLRDEVVQAMNKTDLFQIWNYDGKILYHEIIEATEDFSARYCIGMGGSGNVYRAMLSTGQIVAIKKLEHASNGYGDMIVPKSFRNEIRALTEIRHRNIVKLYGFCSHANCSFFIYEYLERGSLAKVLGSMEHAKELDWSKRINVIRAVANALSYMHHDCLPPIVHRDISSKNILLDLEYEARVSDFGIAKLLKLNSANCTSLAGTHGYIAPGNFLKPILFNKHASSFTTCT